MRGPGNARSTPMLVMTMGVGAGGSAGSSRRFAGISASCPSRMYCCTPGFPFALFICCCCFCDASNDGGGGSESEAPGDGDEGLEDDDESDCPWRSPSGPLPTATFSDARAAAIAASAAEMD